MRTKQESSNHILDGLDKLFYSLSMKSVSQEEAVRATPPARVERARFWRDRHFHDMECMNATFITHEFSPHSHDTFSIGAIEAGCQVAMVRGERTYTGPGALYLLNPGEIHDGQPGVEEGYRYRMIYPDIAVLTEILEDATGRAVPGTPSFGRQLPIDAPMASAFIKAHALIENGATALESEEGMYSALAAILARHGRGVQTDGLRGIPRGVVRARDYIAAHFTQEISLQEVAAAAGLSRAHLIRAFRKYYFITPHAFQTDLRVRYARQLLRDRHGRADLTLADVALACGFADQAHLTRHFKARTGITPAKFRIG